MIAFSRIRFLAPALLVLSLGAAPAAAAPVAVNTAVCADTGARVTARHDRDIALACAGAADAVGWLTAMGGLNTDVPLEIEVRDEVTLLGGDNLAFRILGQYERRTELITVTSLAGQREMASDKPIFGVVYEPALFRSIVAHEVAHAVAEVNFSMKDPTQVAHEYIAYVVQFETMPAALRESILASYTVPGFASEDELHPIAFFMDPDAFAVKAYRFHRSAQGGPDFIRALLRRDITMNFPFF